MCLGKDSLTRQFNEQIFFARLFLVLFIIFIIARKQHLAEDDKNPAREVCRYCACHKARVVKGVPLGSVAVTGR